MKCIEVRGNLEAFVDGEIGSSEKERITLHLGDCDSCRINLKALLAIGRTMKQALPVVAPMSLDARVLKAFDNHQTKKQFTKLREKQEKVGWFGIPKLAFAFGLLLLALFSGLAFQIGKISASNVQVSNSLILKTDQKESSFKHNGLNKNDYAKQVETKIVEVPIIKEKIVKVPVIKEKIVTRTIYVAKNQRRILRNQRKFSEKESLALMNSVKDGEFLTQTNLKDFQPISVIKPKISKKEE